MIFSALQEFQWVSKGCQVGFRMVSPDWVFGVSCRPGAAPRGPLLLAIPAPAGIQLYPLLCAVQCGVEYGVWCGVV